MYLYIIYFTIKSNFLKNRKNTRKKSFRSPGSSLSYGLFTWSNVWVWVSSSTSIKLGYKIDNLEGVLQFKFLVVVRYSVFLTWLLWFLKDKRIRFLLGKIHSLLILIDEHNECEGHQVVHNLWTCLIYSYLKIFTLSHKSFTLISYIWFWFFCSLRGILNIYAYSDHGLILMIDGGGLRVMCWIYKCG